MFLQILTTIAAGMGGGLIAFGLMHAGIAFLDRVAPMKHPLVPGGKG